jgi:hypothetical protein
MTLASVHKGDIVRAGDAHGHVIDKARGKVLVQGIGRAGSRWVKASEIEAHWRRSGK